MKGHIRRTKLLKEHIPRPVVIMSCTQPSTVTPPSCPMRHFVHEQPNSKTQKIFFDKASFPPVASLGQRIRLRPAHNLPALPTAVLDMPLPLYFT